MIAAEAVARLLDNADLLMVGGVAYLLAKVPPSVIDGLAAYSADMEDAEPETIESDGDDGDHIAVV